MLLSLALPWACAQDGGVELELGFGGEIVAGSWNPLRLTVRDAPGAELLITVDQGSLRGGEILAEYRFSLGSGGLVRLEQDFFVPAWRNLSWRLVTPERVLASGSLDRRRLDSRPLTLLVSDDPARWREVLEANGRAAEAPPSLLPERLSAYDGVAYLVIDGSTAMPSLAAVAAATSAGATTLLVEPLPESYRPLLRLAPRLEQRLGAGRLVRVDEGALGGALSGLDRGVREMGDALLEGALLEPPPSRPGPPVLALAGVYALAVLLLLRFAGAPGLLTSLVLALLFSFVAWTLLRPAAPQETRARTLVMAGGELAREDEVRSLFSYPQVGLELPISARPSEALPYRQHDEQLTIELSRWERLGLELKPRLVPAPLVWEGGRLVNRGDERLEDLLVLGLGAQPALLPGEALTPRPGEEGPPPEPYRALVPHLPAGSALARQASRVVVALPPAPPLLGVLP